MVKKKNPNKVLAGTVVAFGGTIADKTDDWAFGRVYVRSKRSLLSRSVEG